MECTEKNCPTTGTFLGNHEILFRTINLLEERLKNLNKGKPNVSKQGYKMSIEEKIHQNMAIHLGSNCFEFDIIQALKKVMRRDWSHVKKGHIGQLFVPKVFLSKYPEVFDFQKFIEKCKERQGQCQEGTNEAKMKAKVCHIKGELAERKVYNAIKKIFKKHNEDVLVIQGLKFMALAEQSQDEIKDFEKDFLVINLTRRYVMSLEVKSCLHTNSLRGSKRQVNGSKKLIDEWLGSIFKQESGWVFLGVMCFDELAPKYSPIFCRSCKEFVIIGLDEGFEEKFEYVSIGREFYGIQNSDTAEDEFLEASEYLLFFAAFEPVIISSNSLSRHVAQNLNKAGSAESIESWRCLTPSQLPLLKSRLAKVLFLNAPSTGKTTLMISEACHLSNEMQEPVLFLIPGTFGKKCKTLLALSMEQHFQSIAPLVEVSTVRRRTDEGIDYPKLLVLLQSDKYSSHHIFIDEIHIETDTDFKILKDIAQLFDDDGRTLWLTVTSMNPKFSVKIRTEFATDFYFPSDLVYPLRNSSQIINYAYNIQGTNF